MQRIKFPGSTSIILVLFSLMMATVGCTQEKTYWVAGKFNKVNGEPMRGATPDYIGEMLSDFQYVVKDGDELHFDFPEKKDVKIDTLKSFTYRRFDATEAEEKQPKGKLIDNIYDIGISDGILQIKFTFEGTGDDDKRFVLKYEKLTEAAYQKEISAEFAYVAEKKKAFDQFIKDYHVEASWKTGNSMQNEIYNLSDDSLGDANITIPENFIIKENGNFYKNTFGKIKVGSMAKNNLNYTIKLNEETSLEDANFSIAKAPQADFNLQQYLAGKPGDFKVIEQNGESFHAVQLGYNGQNKSVTIIKYVSFKHVFKDGLHFFYIADDENSSDIKKSKELAKQHYMLLKSLKIS